MLPNGRVTDLTIGTAPITFCSVDGTELTGGFYIRDNTPTTLGGLPIGAENPNLLDDGSGCDSFDSLTCIGPGEFWEVSNDGDPPFEIIVVTIGGNNVARISVDESPQSSEPPGHYSAIYTDVDLTSSAASKETEMYYLAFEVKTNSGWRSFDDPYAFEDGGIFDDAKYGPHCVLARVEWFSSAPGAFNRESPALLCDTFYAYETTEAHDTRD